MANQSEPSVYDGTTMLTNVKVPDPNEALAMILVGGSGSLRQFIGALAQKGVLLYQGKVAKDTGRLEASAHSGVEIMEVEKGQPRLVGHITVGGDLPVSTWRGNPFYYGVLHNFGRDPSDFSGTYHPAHNDLVDVRDVLVT